MVIVCSEAVSTASRARVVLPLPLCRAKPLDLWRPEDLDGSVEGAFTALLQLGALCHVPYNDAQTRQQLERPTPQFVHRVAVAIHAVSGFLPSVPTVWPPDWGSKVDVFWEMRVRVASVLGYHPVAVSPVDILRCRERQATRWFIQLVAVSAAREFRRVETDLFSACSGTPTEAASNWDSARTWDTPAGTPGGCAVKHCGTPKDFAASVPRPLLGFGHPASSAASTALGLSGLSSPSRGSTVSVATDL